MVQVGITKRLKDLKEEQKKKVTPSLVQDHSTSIRDALLKIQGPYREIEDGWNIKHPVFEAHRIFFQDFIENYYERIIYPKGNGRGIITLSGGRYLVSGYVLCYMLRKLGCNLPIELYYFGEEEVTQEEIKLFESLGDINCLDILKVTKELPRIFGGWEMKIWSMMFSSFSEILFLDSDQFPIRDPSYLFEHNVFKDLGAVFWPDIPNIWGCDITPEGFKVLNLNVPGKSRLPYHHKPSDYFPIESGQIMLNKKDSKQDKAIQFCALLNDHADFFYPQPPGKHFWHVYGDKSLFYLAWNRTECPYHLMQYADYIGDHRGGGFLQRDFDNEFLFQHFCQPPGKIQLNSHIVKPFRLQNYELILEAMESIRMRVKDFRRPSTRLEAPKPQTPKLREEDRIRPNMLHKQLIRDWLTFNINLPKRVSFLQDGKIYDTRYKWVSYERNNVIYVDILEGRNIIWSVGLDELGILQRNEIRLIPAPPPTLAFNQDDPHGSFIYYEIMEKNDYELPRQLYGTVIDIGGHVGCFALAALERGCNKVYSVEPFPENFSNLYLNMKKYGNRSAQFCVAVSDKTGWTKIGFGNKTEGTSGISMFNVSEGILVPSITLPSLLEQIEEEFIRILKIDCEGAEWNIFDVVEKKHLDRVEEVICEYHEQSTERKVEEIIDKLKVCDFEIRIKKHPWAQGLGVLWGTKSKKITS